MAKIVLPDASNGNSGTQRINDNFRKVAEALNDKVLFRDNPPGEPNEMNNDLDMNSNRVYNLPIPTLDHEATPWGEVKGGVPAAKKWAEEAKESALESAESADQSAASALVATEQAERAEAAADSVSGAIGRIDVLEDDVDQINIDLSGKVNTSDLISNSGSSLVGFDGGTAEDVLKNSKPLQNYSELRSYNGSSVGVIITERGLSGLFRRDDSDISTADDGGTVIVDASGRRWKRQFSGSLSPLWFGAKPGSGVGTRDTDADSSAALILTLDAMIVQGATTRTIDLGGLTFAIGSPLIPNRKGGIYGCRITNGQIVVKSTFPGGYVFDLSTNAAVGGRTAFDNLTINGGLSGAMPEAEGIIKLPPGVHPDAYKNTVVIHNNEFREFYGIGIWGQSTSAATESMISNNRIKGSYTGGALTCIGIQWGGNDTEIHGNVIFNTECNIKLLAGGISIVGNHVWNGPGRRNIAAMTATALIINDNYIDNGTVELYDPKNCVINSNKFVVVDETIDDWIARGVSHIVIRATVPNFVVKALSIQGNVFRQDHNPTKSYAPFVALSGGGGFDTTQLHNTFVKDNSFDSLMTPMTTHPRKVVPVSAATSVVADMSDIKFLNWHTLWSISAVFQGGSDISIKNITRSGSVFTVNFTAAATGNLVISASSNSNAT